MIRKLILTLVAAFAALTAAPAFATDCGGTVAGIYTGDGGGAYIILSSGFTVWLPSTDPNLKNVLASANAAMMFHSVVMIRVAGAVNCNGGDGNRTDFQGMMTYPI